MKKILSLTIFLLILFTVSGVTFAATDFNGELRVLFNLDVFSLERLSLKFNQELGSNNGIDCELRLPSIYSGYYYQKDLFKSGDCLDVGYFPITWSAEKSETILESLAQNLDPENGVGLKYLFNFEKSTLTFSLSNTDIEAFAGDSGVLDFAARADLNLSNNFLLGVALASENTTTVDSTQILIDTLYSGDKFQVLGELVIVSVSGGSSENGLYLEGAYNFTTKLKGYIGICSMENLGYDWVVIGGKYQLKENIFLQGELENVANDNQLMFLFKVVF